MSDPVNGSAWDQILLGQVVRLRQDSVQPGDHPDSPYVGLEHIDSGDPRLARWGDATDVTSTKSRFSPGNVLYGKLRPYLDKAVLADREGICSTDILVLDPSEKIDPWFLACLLHTHAFTRHAIANTAGVNHPRTSWKAIASFPFLLPPLPEQRAIARVLRSVQAAREARQHEVALERERNAALMEHLFTHGTRGEPTKPTEIGEMPESWDVRPLGDLSKVISGGTPSRIEPAYWGGDIPWVKTGEIDYGVIASTEETITLEGLENSSARVIPAGTLLMAMYGQGITRGRVAILGIDAAINQACAAIFPSKDELRTDYAFHFLTYSYESIRNLGHGANQKNLNAMLVRSIPIALPSTAKEQAEVAEVLGACDTKIVALEREMALLDELFRALLEELMTGRLSAQVIAADPS